MVNFDIFGNMQKDHHGVRCTYYSLDRGKTDNDIDIVYQNKIGPNSNSIPLKTDVVEIKCLSRLNNIVHHNIIGYPANHSKDKLTPTDENNLAVTMIIFDSTSYSMFRRKVVKSLDYMAKDNPRGIKELSKWPIIWKNFSSKGYLPSYLENRPFMGLFSFKMTGFDYKPVDHFYRPMFISIEESKLFCNSTEFCFGNEVIADMELNILESYLLKFRGFRRFDFMFSKQLTHGYNNDLGRLDSHFHQILKRLHEAHVFNDTALFVMSDHGDRVTDTRQTQIGVLEDIMLLLQCVFLTGFIASTLPLGRDLIIEPKPSSISCQEHAKSVEVSKVYCACADSASMSTSDSRTQEAVDVLISKINQMLLPLKTICANFSLSKIIHGKIYQPGEAVLRNLHLSYSTLRVTFEV